LSEQVSAAEPGPFDRPRRLPDRRVHNPGSVDDGSREMVDLATGELVVLPPSETRARRLAQRAAAHAARLDDARQAADVRAHEWAVVARGNLPRRTPAGLERPAGYEHGGAP
jgi:hypothetical protein